MSGEALDDWRSDWKDFKSFLQLPEEEQSFCMFLVSSVGINLETNCVVSFPYLCQCKQQTVDGYRHHWSNDVCSFFVGFFLFKTLKKIANKNTVLGPSVIFDRNRVTSASETSQ